MGHITGRAWTALLAAGLVVALSGCIRSKPLEEGATQHSLKGQGAAVLRVAYDRNPERGDTETNIIAVRVNRVSGEGRHRARLVRSAHGNYFTATLGGALEPGTYSAYVVEMLWEGQKRSLRLAEGSLLFDVRADSVSVLGTLVISRDDADVAYLPPEGDAAEQWVGQAFPLAEMSATKLDYAPKVAVKIPTPRDGGAELKKRAQATAGWVQLPNGDFMAPGRLGTVLHRHRTSSRKETIDVGAWGTVLFVGALKSGVVAAGEDGLLRFSADGRSGWRQLRGPGRGAIHAVQAFADSKVAAIVRSGDRWAVFVTDDVFGGQWRELTAFSFDASVDLQAHVAPAPAPAAPSRPRFVPIAVATPDKLGIVQYYGAYRIVDLKSGSVVANSMGSFVLEVATPADGTIAVRTRGPVSANQSVDGGASWETVQTPPSTVLAATKNRQTHYAIVSELIGGQISRFSMRVSRDGGATWTQTGTVPIRLGQAEKLWASPANTLQIETIDEGVLESLDEGKTWVRLP